MLIRIRAALIFLITSMFFIPTPVMGAEPTEEMLTFARMFTTLEARDLKGYCAAMHGAPYAGYLTRVCQSAVQNNLKKPEDCSQERIAQQVKSDTAQCLAMPAAEFEKIALRGREASKAFVKEMTAQGVDGDKLLQEERSKLRQAPIARYELLYQGEEVLDKESNLIWKRCANGMQLTQHRCVGKPYGSSVPVPVRETPWRLPTQAELLSLVLQQNPGRDRSKTVVDEAAFPDTPGDRFQAMYEGGSVMLYVDFSTGRPGSSRPLSRYPVRFVRDGPGNR